VSFAPVLDKTLAEVPAVTAFSQSEVVAVDAGKSLQLALSTPVVSKPMLSKPAVQSAASDDAVILVTPASTTSSDGTLDGKADEKMKVQTPLSSAPTTAMHVPKSTLTSSQREAKAMVNKRLSPEQQATHDYQQAIAYLQQGRVAEAQDALRNVLSAMPKHDDARQTLVGLLVDNHHKAEAMEVLQSGLQVSAAQPEFAHTLARLQLDAGQTTDALKTLQTTLPHAKQHAEYQALMAIVLQRLERHQEAIFHYQQALSLGAQPPAWLIGLAVSLQTEGRAEEAKQAYQQAQHGDLTPELAQFVDQRLKQVLQAN
jgi:MSHA biogenesis protein MshN